MARKPRQLGPKLDVRIMQECLLEQMAKDDSLVVLASGLATHTVPATDNPLANLAQVVAVNFPARFYGLGSFYSDLVPTARQLLEQKLQPVVLLGSVDLARSYAAIAETCNGQLPVIFLLASGGFPDTLTVSDLAVLRTFPNLFIGVPSSPQDLGFQLEEARHSLNHPVAVCYWTLEHTHSKGRARAVPVASVNSPGLGRSRMLREGKELAILSAGTALPAALALADKLKEAGHEAAVVDVRWVRPLDDALLTAVASYFPRLITLEEGLMEGSMGATTLEMLEQRELYHARVKRLSLFQNPHLSKLVQDALNFLNALQQEEGLGHAAVTLHLPQSGKA